MTIKSTILANNRVGVVDNDCYNHSAGTLNSDGYNLVQIPNNWYPPKKSWETRFK
jgi:hypothetical protein